jgi:hypothetical protein
VSLGAFGSSPRSCVRHGGVFSVAPPDDRPIVISPCDGFIELDPKEQSNSSSLLLFTNRHVDTLAKRTYPLEKIAIAEPYWKKPKVLQLP